MDLKETIANLRALREAAGYDNFDAAVKTVNRDRILNSDRELNRNKKYLKPFKHKLFDAQNGVCPECGKPMRSDLKNTEVDHKDPNRQDCDALDNLQLIHGYPCNRKKSSKSIMQQSKEKGKTFTEILK